MKDLKVISKLALVLFFLVISRIVYSQNDSISLIEKKPVLDISKDQYYQVALAFYTTKTDTIALLGDVYKEPFMLYFLNGKANDSTELVIEIAPQEVFLFGKIKYFNSFKDKNGRFDVAKGFVISAVKKNKEIVDLILDRYYPQTPEETKYYRLLVIHEDKSILQFIFY